MQLGRTSELISAGVVALAGISYMLITPGEAETGWVSSAELIQSEFASSRNVEPLSPSAARVALTALSLSDTSMGGTAMAALTAQPGAEIDLGQAGRLQVSIIDDDSGDRAFQLFDPQSDPYSPVVLDTAGRDAMMAVNYERPFVTAGEGEGLDVSITPRAGVSVGPDGSAAGAGAEVRIGRYLSKPLDQKPAWFVFAGADRRAVLYDPAQGMDFQDAMYLTHREVIGDAQAGIAMRFGDADLSLAFVHREYRHVAGVTSFDETENFGAVSVNWRW